MAQSNGNISDWLDRLEAVIGKRDKQYAARQGQFEKRDKQYAARQGQFEKRQELFEKRQEQFERRQEQFDKNQQKADQRLQRLERMVAGLTESQNLIYDLQAENERTFEKLKKEQAERDAMVDTKFAELAIAQAITQNNLRSLLEAFSDHASDPNAHQRSNGKNGHTGKKKNSEKR